MENSNPSQEQEAREVFRRFLRFFRSHIQGDRIIREAVNEFFGNIPYHEQQYRSFVLHELREKVRGVSTPKNLTNQQRPSPPPSIASSQWSFPVIGTEQPRNQPPPQPPFANSSPQAPHHSGPNSGTGHPLFSGVVKTRSQNPQRHWDFHSEDSIGKLWKGHLELRSKLSNCMNRLIKLEAENDNIKITRQPAKRGRPSNKRAIDSVESEPVLRGRNAAQLRTFSEPIMFDFDLNKGDESNHSPTNNGSMEIIESPPTMPASLVGQSLQKFSGI